LGNFRNKPKSEVKAEELDFNKKPSEEPKVIEKKE